MKPLALALTLVSSSLPFASRLYAQSLSTEATPVSVNDLTITADLGGSAYAAQVAQGGPIAGASLFMRMGLIEFGAYAQADSAAFYRQHSTAYGLAAGLACQSEIGVRLDLMGTLSVHRYSGWGGDSVMGTDSEDGVNPGGSATLPCAGGRLKVLYLFSRSRSRTAHFVLGWQIGMDQDFRHEFVRYADFDGLPDQTWVGGYRWTSSLVIGGAFDFGSRK
jgi:hypothetical protein